MHLLKSSSPVNISSIRLVLLCLVALMGITRAQTPSPPTFNPLPESFTTPYKVDIQCPQRNTQLYWTEDGSNPTNNSSSAFRTTIVSLTKTTTLNAYCVNLISLNSSSISELTSGIYTQEAAIKPTASPAAGFYNGAITVTLTTSGTSTTIYYTLDGTPPTVKSLFVASGESFQVTPTATLKAVSVRKGYANSGILTVIYNKKETVVTPTANPGATSFSDPLAVTLSSATSGTTLYYTLDNSDPLVSGKIYDGRPITLTSTLASGGIINLRAIATKVNMNNSAELKTVYTYLPRAATPVTNFTDPTFSDSAIIYFTSNTPGATFRITRDGKDPSEASQLVKLGEPIKLYNTETISAITYAAGYKESFGFRQSFALNLSAPIITPFDKLKPYEFKDTLSINLLAANPKAIILYTLNGSDPDLTSSKIGRTGSVTISKSDTTILKAFAYDTTGKIKSPVVTSKYLKTIKPSLAAPQATPPSTQFLDSQLVYIHSPQPDAQVFYTLDGSTPDTVTGKLLDDMSIPILLKSTTILHMRAFALDAVPSGVSEEIYTLIPKTPTATPDPSTTLYPTPLKVTLTSSTPGAILLYSTSGKDFDPTNAEIYSAPITLTQSTVIKAQAALGVGNTRVYSKGILVASYTIRAEAKDSVLANGDSAQLSFYKIKSDAGEIRFKSELSDSLVPPNWTSAGLAINIKSNTDSPFQASLTPGESGKWTLYQVEKGKPPRYVSGFQVIENGLYLFARDNGPPIITLLSKTALPDGETRIKLIVQDDIRNGTYRSRASFDSNWNTQKLLRGPIDTLTLSFKSINLKQDFGFKLQASDYQQTSYFPLDSSRYFQLPQIMPEISTPAILSLGNEKYRYDLVGFPASAFSYGGTPFTMDKLRNDNPDAKFQGQVLNTVIGFSELQGSTPITAGLGLWLASDVRVSSLKLKNFVTSESSEDGDYKISLKPKWNIISNPTLKTLWWPIQRKQAGYAQSQVRGLIAWNSASLSYQTADSLEPWRGYFVYNSGKTDTSVTLSHNKPVSLSKRAINSSPFTWISLQPMTGLPVTLAASVFAKDEIGNEDEPALNSPGLNASSINAIRNGLKWQTDLISQQSTKLMVWKVASNRSDKSKGEIIHSLQVDELNLPAGYSAWAIWPRQQVKQELIPRGNIEVTETDTVTIVAGLSTALSLSDDFQFAHYKGGFINRLQVIRGNQVLALTLAKLSRVKIQYLTADGKGLEIVKSTVQSEGSYEWSIPSTLKSNGKGWIKAEVAPIDGSPSWDQNLRF